jgi:predicted SnoaL-like aldol condensation-catalyzing enzyme
MLQSFLVTAALLSASATAATADCADAATVLPAAPYCPPFPVTPDQQRAIFERFTELFLVTAKFRTAFLDHIAESYIQHNPWFPSGRQVILDLFGNDTADPKAAGYPANIITRSFDSKAQLGMFHYYFTPANGTQPTVTVDIFRMNGSCIEEHWDVQQQRPANATNPLAMFTPKK